MKAQVRIYRRHSTTCTQRHDRVANCACALWLQWQDRPGHQVKKAAGTNDWKEAEKAAQTITRSRSAIAPVSGDPADDKDTISLADAIDRYITYKINQGHEQRTTAAIEALLNRMRDFCESRGVTELAKVTPLLLSDFRATWELGRDERGRPATTSWTTYAKRVKAFFGWFYRKDLIARDPSKTGLEKIKVRPEPTLPYEPEEVETMLAQVDKMSDWDDHRKARVRAAILVERYAGLAVRDIATLRRDALTKDNLLHVGRAKTGVAISVPIPKFVADALRALPENGVVRPGYFFWTGCKPASAGMWLSERVGEVVDAAGIQRQGFNVTHRLRDTFAVQLILAGVAIQDVSAALGHSSVRITEQHYLPWIAKRQNKLAATLRNAWAAQGYSGD